ncbi:gamma-glutamyltransferase family protein [Burkholderia vietnamiensis]|uniref:gamma-glutamyltransferase family protein n=1 Tax=Burkholderia vietnamiensis TaxID=60552 RepID=UPI001D13EB7F|nr:gamma-glutamyltransferase family protein [Burkholderia vietnamiensis]UEC01692.1 gamma-glutamyltransferase family protein [Burkholderia vietnamiensis]
MSNFISRPEIIGTYGVAASTHWLASQTAMSVLERGGNAFDAAVTAGFVLQVVEPHLNGPGGEVPLIFWTEKERRVRVLCGQGCAPRLATPEFFSSRAIEMVPGIGLLPATVPGAFGAWMTMLKDYGTWSLESVLEPAIRYADEGFPLVSRAIQAITAVAGLFTDEWHSSSAVWLPQGKPPAVGELFQSPGIARTYRRVIEVAEKNGSATREAKIEAAIDAWYCGFVAEEIDRFYSTEQVRDTTGRKNTGLLRYSDLAAWHPTYEEPQTVEFGQYTVAKCGPWSQGPVFLQQLGILRHAGLQNMDSLAFEFVHTIAEAAKLAFADRLAWYGDPDYEDVPLATLLSDAYGLERYRSISSRASQSLQPGSPNGRIPYLPDMAAAQRVLADADTRYGVGEPTFAQLPPVREWANRELFVGDTCHLDVIDRHGNMVSATPSGGWLSSSPAIPALGFSISTRLQLSWLDEFVPNRLAPGKRPCTTLSPGLVLRRGQPYMVFGTPGGDQQDQWTLGFFLRHIVHGMNLQEAIEAPAWHIEHFPSSFWPHALRSNRLVLESRFSQETIHALRAAGHEVVVGGDWSEGRISACTQVRDRNGKLLLKAAANPRGAQGYAVGR